MNQPRRLPAPPGQIRALLDAVVAVTGCQRAARGQERVQVKRCGIKVTEQCLRGAPVQVHRTKHRRGATVVSGQYQRVLVVTDSGQRQG